METDQKDIKMAGPFGRLRALAKILDRGHSAFLIQSTPGECSDGPCESQSDYPYRWDRPGTFRWCTDIFHSAGTWCWCRVGSRLPARDLEGAVKQGPRYGICGYVEPLLGGTVVVSGLVEELDMIE